MKKEEKVQEVKELLNQILILSGKSKDAFLLKSFEAATELLKPEEEDEDYYDSDDYYDSNC